MISLRFSKFFRHAALCLLILSPGSVTAATSPFARAAAAAAFQEIFATDAGRVVPGRIEIQLSAPAVAPALAVREARSGHPALDAALAARGLRRLEGIFFHSLPDDARCGDFRDRFFVAHVDPDTDIRAACLELSALPEVETAWPVLRCEARRDPAQVVTPNDPSFSTQYYLNTNGGVGTLRAKGAWGHSLGGSSVVVAVCDTGVDLDHPDLAGSAPPYLDGILYTDDSEYNGIPNNDDDGNGFIDDWRGWDFVNVGSGPYAGEDYSVQDNDPDDFEGHGSSVAGCVNAICDNGVGIAGIGWNTRVMPLRIGWAVEDGEGNMTAITYSSIQASAFNYARSKGAQVINLSYGSSYTPSLASALNACVSAGVIVVVSAGNDGSELPDYLGSTGLCVDVAATDNGDSKADFSNFGAWIDVSAPGVAIFTTAIDGYTSTQGTSFASPITAGLLALIYWQEHAGVRSTGNAANVVSVLAGSCDNIDALNPGMIGKLGAGRINAFQALGGGGFFAYPSEFDDFRDAMDFALTGDTLALLGGATMNEGVINPIKDLGILGGWSADYESRDPQGNPSTIVGTGFNSLFVFNTAEISAACLVDGIRLENGGGGPGYFPDLGTYGGAMLLTAGQPTLSNLIFFNCDLSGETVSGGGGLFVANVDQTLSNCQFIDNHAQRGGGLGVFNATVTLQDCLFQGNTATQALSPQRRGGAVHVENGGLTGQGLSFLNNSADDEGGAVYLAAGSSLDLQDLAAQQNSAGLDGGYLHSAGTAVLRSGAFSDNDAPTGGAIANLGSLTVTGSSFARNGDPASTSFGGAVHSGAGSVIALRSNSFQADEVLLQGAALYASACSGEFLNNTVDGILNSYPGCAVAMNGADLDLRNNQITNCLGGPPLFAGGSPLPSAAYNNFFGNGGGADYLGFGSSGGDTHADPLYADRINGDFNLLLDSPSLDAGDPSILDPDGGRSDIGAHGGPDALMLRPDSPANLAIVPPLRAWYVELDWDDNVEGDLAGYAVYRDLAADFQPGAANRVALLPAGESQYRDEVPDGETVFHYKVSAQDASGYGSGYSNEVSGTGEAETPVETILPHRFALRGAFPNPFNPKTTLSFDLPAAAGVTLRIVASNGRLVLRRQLGEFAAGSHHWDWNGRDGADRPLAAGIYHVLISAGPWEDRVKLTLLK